MTGRINYHSLFCREMSIEQETGELRYETASPDIPVAQFIGPKPLSEKCSSFSFEIVNPGMKSLIAIGLCHRRYPGNRQPGWNTNSIGYHADDGGLYHEDGHPITVFGRVPTGGVMGCSFNFGNNSVTFTQNGKTIFTSRQLQIPPGGFYPIIGLHSHGECVCLLETRPWQPDMEVQRREEKKIYHSLFCREVKISQDSGHVRYNSMSPEIPVGQFVSECSLSPMYRTFSVEIASQGQKCCIAVGICHRRYPAHRMPGWYPNSIAYHADDGGIFHSNVRPCARGPIARVGDTMACEFDFSTNKVIFYRNDTMVYQSQTLRVPPGGFHAAIGFKSHGEEVCLLETEPWRSAAEETPPPVEQKYHFSKCSIASLNQTSGVLSYVGPTGKVAQLISKCPLTPEQSRFSVELVHLGRKCCIAVGLCPQHYPEDNQPGWRRHSIAYHSDNGGIYANSDSAITILPIAREGDVITCQFNFSDKTVSFFIKGQKGFLKVYQSSPLTIPPGSFYAAVGLHSEFESVRLCEAEPWRAEDPAPCLEPGVTRSAHSMPMCSICMDKAVTKFLIPCGHTFCGECIEEWLSVQKYCPTCRVGNIEAKPLFFG